MNVEPDEVRKFDALASRWWDPEGDFKPLHDINPARVAYIRGKVKLSANSVLDVGCGGGILSESLSSAGARVTGLDAAERPLGVARLHALESNLEIEYLQSTAETLAEQRPGHYQLVTCLEMLEHVPDFASTVRACAELTEPDGHLVFSTINRNLKSYLMAVVGAEYLLRLLPRGTHDYARFIRPSELARAVREAGLSVDEIIGMRYNPITRTCTLTPSDTDVNYLLYARKPGLS